MDELNQFQDGAAGLEIIDDQPPAAAAPVEQEQPQQETPQQEAKPDTIDNPVGQFMENMNVNIRDFIDNTFEGDKRSKDEIREDRRQVRVDTAERLTEQQEATANDGGIGEFTDRTVGEATRAVAGGLTGAVEGIGETAELLGDTIKQGLGLNAGDNTQNPFSDEYESADWDLGITENKTVVGGFARNAITLLAGMRLVPGGNLAQGSRVGRVGVEAARGAIADFFVGGTDENLSNMLEEGFQVLGFDIQTSNALTQAISIDDDDNPYVARLKNMVEGGVFGVAVDGVSELIGAFRAGRQVRAAGGTAEEAADAVIEYVQGNLDLGVRPTKPLRAEDVFTEVTDGDLSRLGKLEASEIRSLINDYGVTRFTSPKDIIKNLDPEVAMEALDEAIYTKKLPNGTEIDWMARKLQPNEIANVDIESATEALDGLPPELQRTLREFGEQRKRAMAELVNQDVVRIDWDLQSATAKNPEVLKKAKADYERIEGNDLGKKWEDLNEAQQNDWLEGMRKDGQFSENVEVNLGSQGVRLYSQFGEVAKEQKPGTIIQAQAAEDGFGNKGLSDAQGRRADQGGEVPNIREKLYQRSGLSAPGDDGIMYGIVKYRPDGRKVLAPLDLTKPIQEQVDAAMEKPIEMVLNLGDTSFDKGFKPEGEYRRPEPGRAQRVEAQRKYGSTPQTEALYEPSDAASRTSANRPQDAALSQARAEAYEAAATPVGARAILTDEAYDLILSPRATADMTADAVAKTRAVIAKVGSSIDVDQLSRDLGQANSVTVAKALNAVRDFIGADPLDLDAAMKSLDKVSFLDDAGNRVPNREAVVALKTLIKDTAIQLSEVSGNLMDGAVSAADFTRQAEMLVPRLKALMRFHKVGSVHYASGLQSFRLGSMSLDGAGKMTRELDAVDKQLDELLALARRGDAKGLEEFKNLANGLVVSGGDPKKILSFWQLFRRVGGREALTTMYNSLLSGPVTHTRNMIGNAVTTVLRPASMAMGHAMTGNFDKAGAALGSFHSFHESVWEALKVGSSTFKTGMPLHEGQKFASYTKEAASELDTLRSMAKTNAEKGAVFYLTKVHDFVNNPWMVLPSRLLTASDDAFKTLTARMEMKRQVFEESLDSKSAGFGFDEKRYAELMEQKLGVNGEILDQKLLNVSKENTFQQELKGTMAKIAELSDSSPLFKYFLPFVRTPHNLMVYAGTHTPIINRFMREYKEVMASGDEAAIAVMRGREAIGWMSTMSAVSLALTGTITGNGPVDPQKRAIWLKTHQPQSIKVGGKWISFESVEPLNVIFAAAADMVELAKAGDTSAYDRNFGQLAYTIAQATYNRSYFQGLQTAVAFMNPQELAKGESLPREVLKAINTFIPLSGARRQLAKALAPGMYEYRNELDRALGTALPGYNAMVGLEKIDIFTGDEIMTNQDNAFNWLLPFKIDEINTDPVLRELTEKGIDFNTVMKTAEGVELTAQDKVAIDKLTAEQPLHKNLKALFEAEWFKADYEAWKKAKGSQSSADVKDSRWYEAVVREIQRARGAAVDQYRSTNEDFEARYMAANADRYNAGRGNYDELSNLQQK